MLPAFPWPLYNTSGEPPRSQLEMEAAAMWEEEGEESFEFDMAADIDAALLMELLEEEAAADNDDDRIGPVLRSLEAEISAAGTEGDIDGADDDVMVDFEPVHLREECEECRLDDILAAGIDGHGFAAAAASSEYRLVEENLGWVEYPCSDIDLYMDEHCIDDDLVGMADCGGEARGQHAAFCCSVETCLEEQHLLWEY